MQCFMIAFLYLLFVQVSEGITTHSATGCSYSALLNCSITERIHEERITYYNGTDCNQAVTDLQVCGQPLTGSDTGLSPSCNGKVSCKQVFQYCPGSKAAKLHYRCIPGNDVKDMCDEFIIDNVNRIFLSTPNYPSRPTFTDISPCRCSIRGASITSIQILELRLHTSTDGTKSSLEINYGDVTYKTESFSDTSPRRVYNKRLSTTSTTAVVILNHNTINGQFLWIEIQGVSIHVSCNNDTNEKDATTSSSSPRLTSPTSSPTTSSSSPSFTITSSPPTSTTSSSPYFTTPTSSTSSQSVPEEPNIDLSSSTDSSSSSTTHPPQTADIKSHSQDKDTTIIILAVLLSLCLLIICITAIIIFVLLRRKKLVWVKKSPQVERERSPYSGLDLNQRVSRSDGTYQELNTRNSTPQYNNVSQNTHNDYYNLN